MKTNPFTGISEEGVEERKSRLGGVTLRRLAAVRTRMLALAYGKGDLVGYSCGGCGRGGTGVLEWGRGS